MSDQLSAECAGIQTNNGFLLTSTTIHLYTHRDNLFITVDLQGDTSQPPVQGFDIKSEV